MNLDINWEHVKKRPWDTTETTPKKTPICPTCFKLVKGALVEDLSIKVYHSFCDKVRRI